MKNVYTKKAIRTIAYGFFCALLSNSFLPLYLEAMENRDIITLLAQNIEQTRDAQVLNLSQKDIATILNDTNSSLFIGDQTGLFLTTLNEVARLLDADDYAPALSSILESSNRGNVTVHKEIVLIALENEVWNIISKHHAKITDDILLGTLIDNLHTIYNSLLLDECTATPTKQPLEDVQIKALRDAPYSLIMLPEYNETSSTADATITRASGSAIQLTAAGNIFIGQNPTGSTSIFNVLGNNTAPAIAVIAGTAQTGLNIVGSTATALTITPGLNTSGLSIATSGTAAGLILSGGTPALSITAGGTTIVGITNINTTGSTATSIATGGTGTLNLGNTTGNTVVTGSLTASTGLTATTNGVTATAGNITATAGNINATAGSISAGTTITAGTGLTVTSGGATITAGGLTVTAGGAGITGITNINTTGSAITSIATGGTGALNLGNTTGNTLVTGSLTASTGLTATTNGVTATAGNITATAGNITTTNGSVIIGSTAASTVANDLDFQKSRTGGVITSGDTLGNITFQGYDGTSYIVGSKIISVTSGTIATSQVASDLEFFTHPASITASTQRMLINSAGNVTINTPDSGVGLIISGGGLTSTGTTTLSSLTAGVLSTNGSGVVTSTATTPNTVQIGNATGGLISLTIGTNGQVLIGATSAAPAFGTLTSTGGTIVFTPGAHTLNLEASAATASSFITNAGTAIPSAGALTIIGGSNINTSGAGSTVTINLNTSPSVSGSLTAGTTVTAGTGIIVTTGGLTVNAGGATIVGIDGTVVGASSAVLVNSSGQLGTATSSRRYKDNITDLSTITSTFMQLKPVSFTYKADPTHALQYGLVAEDVEALFPDLVMYNNDGAVQTVQYHLLHALYIKMIQDQQQTLDTYHNMITELLNRVQLLEQK